jgi:hypothetical protein
MVEIFDLPRGRLVDEAPSIADNGEPFSGFTGARIR